MEAITIQQYRDLLASQTKRTQKSRAHHKRGKAAQRYGKLAEAAVDLSLENYARQGLLAWKATGSKTRTYIDNQGGRQVQHIGPGPPDRFVTLAPDGKSLYLEIKHLKTPVTTALIDRAFQYDDLLSNVKMGGLGGYLIWWAKHSQWRYHPVSACLTEGFGKGLKVRVNYEGGLAVPSYGLQPALLDGLTGLDISLPEPDWLEIAISTISLMVELG